MLERTRFQHGSLMREARKSGPAVWVFRWRESTPQGRMKRKVIVGSTERIRTKAAAEKACAFLRTNINREIRSPRRVAELIDHYTQAELGESTIKAHSTCEVYGSYLNTWVLPHWGQASLSEVRTVAVESWLSTLPLANGSKAKLRNVMSALFAHAMRHEFIDRNPISLVRQSAKRQRLPDVLTTEEIRSLLTELPEPHRTAVFLAAVTGLRVSELLALKWSDVDFGLMEIHLCRAIVNQVVGPMKTEASQKPLPMDTGVAAVLLDWRRQAPYNQPDDWVFGSPEMQGTQPYWPDSLMRKVIHPAAVRARISKRIGWHTFRHSYATLLKANGEDVKVVQESLRHANSRITLDTYTQGLMPAKRLAQGRVVGMIQGGRAVAIA